MHKHGAERDYERERRRQRNAVEEFFTEPNLIVSVQVGADCKRLVEEIDSVCDTQLVVHFETVVNVFAVDNPVSALGHIAVTVVVSDAFVPAGVAGHFVYETQADYYQRGGIRLVTERALVVIRVGHSRVAVEIFILVCGRRFDIARNIYGLYHALFIA